MNRTLLGVAVLFVLWAPYVSAEVVFEESFTYPDATVIGNGWVEGGECNDLLCTQNGYSYYASFVEVFDGRLAFHYTTPSNVLPPWPARPYMYKAFGKKVTLPVTFSFTFSPTGFERALYAVGLMNNDTGMRPVYASADDTPLVPNDGISIVLGRTDLGTNNSGMHFEQYENGVRNIYNNTPIKLPFQFKHGFEYTFQVDIDESGEVNVHVSNGQEEFHTVTSLAGYEIISTCDGFFLSDLQTGTGANRDDRAYFDDIRVVATPQIATNTPPTIDLVGGARVRVETDGVFEDPGVVVEDAEEGSAGVDVDIEGEVDTHTPGEYTLTYTATDSGSLSASVVRTVVVGPVVSNVAFLPGIMGSRLYTATNGDEKKRWERVSAGDVAMLGMDDAGESSVSGVYTRDIVGEMRPVTGLGSFGEAYAGFEAYMDTLVAGGKLTEWRALPYDWRLAPDTVFLRGHAVENGVSYAPYEGATSPLPFLLASLTELASTSPTGKVSIIAHSNGGLVAKHLIRYLEETHHPLLDMIDTVALIASPQAGTPKAIREILHGIDMPAQQTLREVLQNMPGAYGLLPSAHLVDGLLDEPVIEVAENVRTLPVLGDVAGAAIRTYNDFIRFLVADVGTRTAVSTLGYMHPNILSRVRIAEATEGHEAIDTYTFPEHIRTVQVAGNGLWTPRGVAYRAVDKKDQSGDMHTILRTEWLAHTKGDGTVVSASAGSGVADATYYFGIDTYNRDTDENRAHTTLLASTPIQTLIWRNVLHGSTETPLYMSTQSTTTSYPRFELRAYSPIDPHLYAGGKHTGIRVGDATDFGRPFEMEVPNSFYEEWVDVKYLGGDRTEGAEVRIVGTGEGWFTLALTTYEGDVQGGVYEWIDIPVTVASRGTIALGVETEPVLHYDYDGDGEVDAVLQSGESFTPEDGGEEYAVSFDGLRQAIRDASLQPVLEKWFLLRVDGAEKLYQKGNKGNVVASRAILLTIAWSAEHVHARAFGDMAFVVANLARDVAKSL